jgi:hypothetical protein
MNLKKKKKDFKIRLDIITEFEKMAPSGKQTTIVEQLIARWIAEQKTIQLKEKTRRAYERVSKEKSR